MRRVLLIVSVVAAGAGVVLFHVCGDRTASPRGGSREGAAGSSALTALAPQVGGASSSGASAAPEVPLSIGGRVTAEDGSPHPATVVARSIEDPWADAITAQAIADGTFIIPLSPGTWWIHAESEGLLSGCEKVLLAKESAPEPLSLELNRARTIHGLVLGPSNRPVVGAILASLEWNVDFLDVPKTISMTDGDGGYRLLIGPLGGTVRVQAAGLAPAAHRFRTSHDPEERYDFHLEVACRLSGRIVDRVGRPIAGAELRVEHGQYDRRDCYPFRWTLRSGKDGRYDLPALASGWHGLTIEAEGYLREEVCLDLAGTTERDITLIRGGVVEGQLLGPTGTPVPGAFVELRPAEERGSSAFLAYDVSGSDGRFQVPAVRPGKYFLRAMANAFALTEGRDFEVPDEGVAREELRLVVGATLRGTVRSAKDGAPIAAASISRVGEDGEGLHSEPELRWLDTATTDENGAFDIQHVSPGRVRYVVEHARHRAAMLEVDLQDGEVRQHDVILSEGGVVSGRVHLGRADVSEYVDLFLETLEFGSSDYLQPASDGHLEIAGLPAGPFVLRMQWHLGPWCDNAPGWVLAVEPGEPLHLDIPLAGQCHLRGVLRSRGAPAPHHGFRLDSLDSDVGLFYRVVIVNEDGRYEVSSVQPGRYVVTTDRSIAVEKDSATGRLRLKQETRGDVIVIPAGASQADIDINLPEPK